MTNRKKHPEGVDKKGKANSSEKTETSTPQEQLLANKDEEILSYIERLKRLQAEFENYKKRIQRDIATISEQVSDQLIADFLPIFDNLRRAFDSLDENNATQSFIDGIRGIFSQFDQLLKQKGVAPIMAVGKAFDPARHEALLSTESKEEKNTIIEEFERGYFRSDRVLRPSKVKVSKGMISPEEEKS